MKKNDDIPRLAAEEKIKVDIDFEDLNIRKKRRFPYFVFFLILVFLLIIIFFIFKNADKQNLDVTVDAMVDNVSVWQGAFESEEVFNSCREASVSVIAEGRICSGFVYSSDGWIATLEGIVNDNVKGQIEVVLFDGRHFLVESFRQNRESGLILMKINASNLKPVNLDSTSKIFAGEELFTFCSVGDSTEGGSLFSGKIAHTQRIVEVHNLEFGSRTLKLFQIGILLTEEGVGAPLFNEKGELVGISCASSVGGERYMIDYAFEFERVSAILESMKLGKRAEKNDISLIIVE
ncbi:MAG: trypsin-like peptidase domain-containing protein [Ruminococcaceae bacterium]|nr:trypsin-like peptidase domain-containing protein [Oscillospiraceae bacterium]